MKRFTQNHLTVNIIINNEEVHFNNIIMNHLTVNIIINNEEVHTESFNR